MESQQLSDRELEILELVSQGKSNKQIAADLFISINTVKVHLSNIFRKIQVSSRTEATLYAIEHGLILQSRAPKPQAESSVSNPSENVEDTKRTMPTHQLALIFIAAIVVIGVAIFAIVRFSQPTEGAILNQLDDNRWVRMDDLPSPLSQAAAITYDSQIYLIGGYANGVAVSNVRAYNIQTNTWSNLADKPTPIREANAAVLGEKIYLPGGITSTDQPTSTVEVFYPASNSWSQVEPLPQPLSNYALEVFEGKLYVFGGINQNGIQDQVYSYDPSSDQWTEEEPLPQKRAYFDSTQWGGRIFLVGGSDGNEDLNLVESYLPSSLPDSDSSFRQEIALPEPAVNCKAEQLADTLFVICPSKVMKLSPDRTSWITEPNPEGFALGSGFTLAYFNNSLYIMGGNNASGESEPFFVRFQALYSIMLPLLTND